MTRAICAISCAALAIVSSSAVGQSTAPVPVLVELFTSEGCSSCPPADDLLIDLISRQPVDGVVVLGLSEHVDYWDSLGWKDPFSDRIFTQRQSRYAASSGTNDVYTPQVVVDGVESLVGSDRKEVLAAIRRSARKPKVPIIVERASAGTAAIVLKLDSSRDTGGASVFLAIVEDGLASSVKRGENAGRVLRHASVVRRLTRVGRAGDDGGFQATVPLVLAEGWKRDALRIVAFAQADGGRVLAAGAMVTRP